MAEKSFLAGAAEPILRARDGKRKFTEAEACTAYISAMAKRNQQPYKLPAALKNRADIAEHSFRGMQYFTIGEENVTGEPAKTRLLYLHGGSYFAPPNLFHWDMLRRIAELTGALIFVPIYPRAPIHTCLAAYSLLNDLYAQVVTDTAEGGFKKLVVMGDSAGGGLALGLIQQLGEGARLPDKTILLSPWLDISMENSDMRAYEDADPILGIYGLRRMGRLWAGSLDPRDPRVSPIYGSLAQAGELTVFVGTHEIFYPEALRLADSAAEQGVPLRLEVGEGLDHVWVSFPIKEARAAVEKIALIITE